MQDAYTLLAELVQFQSITPQDAGCQEFLIGLLKQMGFTCQRLNNAPVSNFYASIGSGSPRLIFAGHTDVVPAGDEQSWNTPPFVLHEKDGILYGRGVADMKGSLACMITMAHQFLQKHPDFKGTLGFLITSGEEGDDYDKGTPHVMEYLKEQHAIPDYCVVGEPSSVTRTGDMIKVGRRGSLSAQLTLQGKQGHVAYPHLACNVIHDIAPALAELTAKQWDQGNPWFPPTTLQITNIQAGGHANNIIPGTLTLNFNFRYSTEQTPESLQKTVMQCFEKHQLEPEIIWRLSGHPFLTAQGALVEACIQSIETMTNQSPELSTSGGTSDGRFIAPYGVEVVEVGLINASIHQVNEHILMADLRILEAIYLGICEQLLVGDR